MASPYVFSKRLKNLSIRSLGLDLVKKRMILTYIGDLDFAEAQASCLLTCSTIAGWI